MRKYNNPRLLNTVVAGPGMKHPTKPHVIVGDNGEFIQGDLMDANAVGELVDQKIDDSEEHIIPKIDELSEQLEQEITNREAADEDLSETIDSRIQDVVGAAPEALDTLKELADALNDDANFAATVTNELTELDERVDNNTSGISSLNTRVESLETSTSDWNENDPTSPSYIKNRTHYEETSERILYTGNIAPAWRENSDTFFDIPLDSLMQLGEEIEMKITPRGADGSTVLRGIAENGGKAILKTSYYPSGPSASLYNEHQAFYNLVIYGINVPQDADFEIKALNTTVHVLNEKFIPATIARTADIDLSYLTGVSGIEMSSGGTLDMGLGSISNVKHLTMYTGGEFNMSGGTISGISQIDMNGGTLDMGPGTIIVSGTGAAQLEHIKNVKDIKFNGGVTLTTGNGASVTGTGAIWAKNFGVSGDLLFSESSSVRREFLSGTLPTVTIERTIQPGTFVYTDTISLGTYKTLSVTDMYKESTPLQPQATFVEVSGALRVYGGIQPGAYYNNISGGWNGIDINTSSSAKNPRVAINGVEINKNGSISEVATLSFKSGGTLAPSVIGVQEIFGKNNVHISMSGSTTGDGIDFGNAPLKNINGIVMSTSSGIISGTLQGTIQSTTFNSGNTFTTGFIDELKTALGLS